MKSSKPFFAAVAVSLMGAAVAAAARVDFNDPRRALGREGDIRVDAELAQDAVSPNSPITVTYQIQNLSKAVIAVADKVADTDFDLESLTVTLAIGAEIPPGTQMPHLVTINPGEKRVLTACALLHVVVPNVRTRWTAVPRYVQVKVTVLRDVTPFATLIEQQTRSAAHVALPNSMFDRWVEASDSILLNAIPVYWKGDGVRGTAESDRPAGTE
jgi:hypothetical protein